MKILLKSLVAFGILLGACQTTPIEQADKEAPFLLKKQNHSQLIVDGKPFLMLGGELGNSSASNLDTLDAIMSKLELMQLNTVLIPVYWELFEPVEGGFDFRNLDWTIREARMHNLKIVFLWFGSWKNSMSCYAPYWVKTDQDRFPLARKQNGEPVQILSPFYPANIDADKKAFTQFMQHIERVDSKINTVIMVQVENEIGMIPEARDYSEAANIAFEEEVPAALIEYLNLNKEILIPEFDLLWAEKGYKQSGSWEEIFGRGKHCDELFMAWYFAKYTNEIAAAGKAVFEIPMYANAALIRPGYEPGQYPSAGPLPHLMDIWRAAAPSLDFIAPDIYFKSFAEWCAKYDRSGNPLFIPEAGNMQSMANAFYAFAAHDALGYCPFSIESLENPEDNKVSRAYDLLHQLSPLIIEKQGTDEIAGVLFDNADQTARIEMGDFVFNVRHEYSWPYAGKLENEVPRYGGLIIKLSDVDFLIAGTGLIVRFESLKGNGYKAGIGSLDEVEFRNGEWQYGRRMNGDQSHQGRHLQLPGMGNYSMQKVKLYSYK